MCLNWPRVSPDPVRAVGAGCRGSGMIVARLYFVNLRWDYKEINLGFWKLKMFGFTWRRRAPTASTTELLLHA